MAIFDNIEWTGEEPASHLIGRFDYLNASARQEAALVRAVLEDMLTRYPEHGRENLVGRIRSRNERLHMSAVFELVLHDLLLQRGFQIVEIEPEMTNGRAPDFLVETPDHARFYLEATIAWGEEGADPGADRRMREVLQAIDDVQSPDFFLSLHTKGMPAQQVSAKKLRKKVQAFVDGLDHEAVKVAMESGRPGPVFKTDVEGVAITIDVVPKNTRGKGGRAIGGRMLPGGWVKPHEAIGAAVKGKAGRYGQLDLPYVVAVNALEQFADGDSATDALFGTESVAVRNNRTRIIRNPDGVWYGRDGPRYRRLSGVLSVMRLSAWDLGQRTLTLTLNPWASNPLPSVPLGVPVKAVSDETLVTTPGSSLRELLDLPEGWPE